jgi:hypothetical protein
MLHFLLAPVALITLVASDDSVPYFVNGNQLFEMCADAREIEQATCVLYVKGVADAFTFSRAALGKEQCIPPGVNGFQLRDIAAHYLAQHAENRQESAAILMALAFQDAWKCSITP